MNYFQIYIYMSCVFQPSSSSRAAELLTQSGSTPTRFVGFGGLGGAQAYVPASQAFDDVDTCLDSDFRVVLRKLTKRDATTKIKVSQANCHAAIYIILVY